MAADDFAAKLAAEWHEVLIIGAGFGGLRMLHECREIGLDALVLEAGSDLGGTWYWNRYPGARTDTESWAYCFYFSKALNDGFTFKERFATQQQSLDYLNHAADVLALRRDLRFGQRVASAHYDDAQNLWTVITTTGARHACRYLVSASGLLSVTYKPPFRNVDAFQGETYITGHWPKTPVNFAGKRVAVIGTGASAVQAIPIIAHEAAQLTVFQRTPNYVMPARNYVITDAEQRELRAGFDAMVAQCHRQIFAFPMEDSTLAVKDVSPEEQQRVLERGWEAGGFRFLFETFYDLLIDRESNEVAAEFVRRKIRTIVRDPVTAERLCPKYPLLAKRPPLGHFYFETFNRPNVTLVDVGDDPIEEITATGVKTGSREFGDFDIIVYATGFDASTGALMHVDVRGRAGQSLADTWNREVQTQLGICMNGFPNLFMISGPQAPFANIPMVIDRAANWIGGALRHLKATGQDCIEARPEACRAWTDYVQMLLDATLLSEGSKLHSWFLGANIPGKKSAPLFYFGGAPRYFGEIDQEAQAGYPGFELSSSRVIGEVA
ncbi:flavin-containing monooxygenase [Nevskia ramosa]|uniref:flavin-containing monooxygenase n=1 Tax=Nevskia ramosa TaxID=64002 RepID=UPI0003B75300|nr:NAD(P)/FAD-dependent oxidoreductase [Nevskia ramosa]